MTPTETKLREALEKYGFERDMDGPPYCRGCGATKGQPHYEIATNGGIVPCPLGTALAATTPPAPELPTAGNRRTDATFAEVVRRLLSLDRGAVEAAIRDLTEDEARLLRAKLDASLSSPPPASTETRGDAERTELRGDLFALDQMLAEEGWDARGEGRLIVGHAIAFLSDACPGCLRPNCPTCFVTGAER